MTGRAAALAGSLLFLVIAPGTIAGLIPYLMTRWRLDPTCFGVPGERIVGAAIMAVGIGMLLECFLRFALRGRGTPAPVAPPERLVVTGLYRHVRNPMYVAIVTIILGQALLLGSRALLWYAVVVWTIFHSWVIFYEEPALRGKFGAEYDAYRSNVRRWWPRLRPWRV